MLPWRGTFADPDLAYETGQGVLLVEQEEVPNHLRQAAVTENPRSSPDSGSTSTSCGTMRVSPPLTWPNGSVDTLLLSERRIILSGVSAVRNGTKHICG